MSQFCPRFFWEDDTKNNPLGDILDEISDEMSLLRGELADHVEDHVVLSPEGTVFWSSPGRNRRTSLPPLVERLSDIQDLPPPFILDE